MKKLFLMMGLAAISAIGFGQQDPPTEFKYRLEGDPVALVGSPSVLNDYVVITYDSTTNESINYQRVYNWVLEMYQNPDEVIVANNKDQFLKIKGFSPNLYFRGGYIGSQDVRYSISFKFRENKVKMEILDIEYYTPPNYKANVSGGWFNLSAIYVHKTNGKPKTSKIGQCVGMTDVLIESYFNGLVYQLTNYTTPTNNAIDNSDW